MPLSAPFSITISSASSALATACAALGSGGSNLDWTPGNQSSFGIGGLSWQTAFYHDAGHNLIHLMGKSANADSSWEHQYYTVDTGVWTVVSNGMWNNSGHIYGNFTMDELTGDVFIARGGMNGVGQDPKRVRWWKYSQIGSGAAAWNNLAPVNQDIYAGGLISHSNGVAWHPNLFGPGSGGLVVEQQFRTMYWRKSNDAVSDTAHATDAYGDKEGAGCYWPSQDAAFVGGSIGKPLLRVTPNAGGLPITTSMGLPPINTAGNSHESGGGFGSLHVHPGNAGKLLIVETAGSRAYTSTNGTTWTQIGNHPFNRVPRVVCSLRGNLGCLWAIGNDGSNFSQLWKPPA